MGVYSTGYAQCHKLGVGMSTTPPAIMDLPFRAIKVGPLFSGRRIHGIGGSKRTVIGDSKKNGHRRKKKPTRLKNNGHRRLQENGRPFFWCRVGFFFRRPFFLESSMTVLLEPPFILTTLRRLRAELIFRWWHPISTPHIEPESIGPEARWQKFCGFQKIGRVLDWERPIAGILIRCWYWHHPLLL